MAKGISMMDLIKETGDVIATLEVDGNALIIRVSYLPGDAEDIKRTLEGDYNE